MLTPLPFVHCPEAFYSIPPPERASSLRTPASQPRLVVDPLMTSAKGKKANVRINVHMQLYVS